LPSKVLEQCPLALSGTDTARVTATGTGLGSLAGSARDSKVVRASSRAGRLDGGWLLGRLHANGPPEGLPLVNGGVSANSGDNSSPIGRLSDRVVVGPVGDCAKEGSSILDEACGRLHLLGGPLGEPGGPSSKFGKGIDKSVCSPHGGRDKVTVGVAGSAEAEAGGVRRHPSELSANLHEVVVEASAYEPPCPRKSLVVGYKVKRTLLHRVEDAFAVGHNRWDSN